MGLFRSLCRPFWGRSDATSVITAGRCGCPGRCTILYRDILTTRDRLSGVLEHSPTPAELAEELEVTEEEILRALECGTAYGAASLDAPEPGTASSEDGGRTLGETISNEDEDLDLVEQRASVRDILNQLPERERRIIVLRYFGDRTQAQIAKGLGISQMHISRLLSGTIDRIRSTIESDIPQPLHWPTHAMRDPSARPEQLGHRRPEETPDSRTSNRRWNAGSSQRRQTWAGHPPRRGLVRARISRQVVRACGPALSTRRPGGETLKSTRQELPDEAQVTLFRGRYQSSISRNCDSGHKEHQSKSRWTGGQCLRPGRSSSLD